MATALEKILHVGPAQTEDEVRLAHELMAKTQRPNYHASMDWFVQCGYHYPNFRREHTRVAHWGTELAGALRLTTETLRLGEARLKTGGLGWVSTDPRHRNRGVASALVRDAVHYMRNAGYHVSMLFGIPNFYQRFGYAPALAEYAVTVDAEVAASAGQSSLRRRDVKPGDIAAIRRIFDASTARIPCSFVRSRAHFSSKWEQFRKAVVLTNDAGNVVAYVLARSGSEVFVVEEIGALDQSCHAELLILTGELACDAFHRRIQFLIPPGHAFTHFLTGVDSRHEMIISARGGGMMAFVVLSEALESMLPEWEGRVQRSAVANERVEVTFHVDRIPYRLRSNRGLLDVAEGAGRNKLSLSAAELIQLVTGYAWLDDVLARERRFLPPDVRALLYAIFPKRDPCLPKLDQF